MGLFRPDPLLYIGQLARPIPPLSTIPTLPDAEALEDVPLGSFFRRWDFVSQYNQDCLKPSEIEPWRCESDPLADRVVDQLGLIGFRSGKDAYEVVREYLDEKEPEGGQGWSQEERDEDVVWQFWQEMSSVPPDGVDGFCKTSLSDKTSPQRTKPLGAFEKVEGNAPTLAEGQRVFWQYSGQIFVALMHFSLAGGFSSPKLASVMHETNYLTSQAKEATYKRLLETTLFVLDAMSDMTIGTGRGWKSAMRVRLLHAQVRRRIVNGKGRYNSYSVERDGIPINQADLLAVLGAFCVGPVWSMKRNGTPMTRREIEAYQVAWRHVGYYLGIRPSLLARYYGSTWETTESSFASLAYAIFPSGPAPADAFSTPQYKILSAVSARPPRGKPIGHHLELCRLCIGPKLAEQLSLPRGTWRDWCTVETERLMSLGMLTFGHLYSTYGGARGQRWETRRRDFFRLIVEVLVVWQLGQRRTVFAWRDEASHGDKLGELEGEKSDLEFGEEAGARIRKEWRSLLLELGVVVGSLVTVTGAVVGLGVKRWIA
ncbi:hypothetical protein JCM10212_001931 [Sporobolomyces blumeae]